MRTRRVVLQAGVKKPMPVNGNFFQIVEAAGPLTVTLHTEGKGQDGDPNEGVRAGFYIESPHQISQVVFLSDTDQVIRYSGGNGRAGYSAFSLITSQSATTDNIEPAVLTTGAELVIAADNTRRRLVLTAHRDNAGAVAVGGPALTAANAARWLNAGESYVENDAAPAALYALAETADDLLCIEVA